MILPVFLPHLGCGQRCIYCNQDIIAQVRFRVRPHHEDNPTTARSHQPTPPTIAPQLLSSPSRGEEDQGGAATIGEGMGGSVIANVRHEGGIEAYIAALFDRVDGAVEVGLYGGNVPGLPVPQIDRLFRLFQPYRDRITGFRLSAKPGDVNRDRVRLLKNLGVHTVELGIPTFNDSILALLNRGHTVEDLFATYTLLREEGIETGLQVMVGLPGESAQDLRDTVSSLVRLAPSFIRIYPLVVIEGTTLAGRYKQGVFLPDSLEAAVAKAAFIYAAMKRHGIRTIKMGLTENDVLKEKIMAGPYHPAFGYLVKSEAFRAAVISTCRKEGFSGNVRVLLNRTDVPHLIGYKRTGLQKLKEQAILAEWTESDVAESSFILEASGKRAKGEVGAVAMIPL